MDQLICHLLGDYVLQTDWMARTKVSSMFAAIIHALVYTLPFALITGFSWALAVIFSTHVLIDRYRLAGHIMRIKQWPWGRRTPCPPPPPEMHTILLIVIDNTIHLTINYLSIKYLG